MSTSVTTAMNEILANEEYPQFSPDVHLQPLADAVETELALLPTSADLAAVGGGALVGIDPTDWTAIDPATSDTQAAFDSADTQITVNATGRSCEVGLSVLALPSDGETFTIGADTYEWDDNAAVGPGNIAVTIGLDAAASLVNAVAEINASGTEDVMAVMLTDTNVAHVIAADGPGGIPVPVFVRSITLAHTMVGLGNGWVSDVTDIGDGRALKVIDMSAVGGAALVGLDPAGLIGPAAGQTDVQGGVAALDTWASGLTLGLGLSDFRLAKITLSTGAGAAGTVDYAGQITDLAGNSVAEQHYICVVPYNNVGVSAAHVAVTDTASDGHIVVEVGERVLSRPLANGTFAGSLGNFTAGAAVRVDAFVVSGYGGNFTLVPGLLTTSNSVNAHA